MPPGEIVVTCPNCQNRARLPFAAVKRDNFYCAKCAQKIPLNGVRPSTEEGVAFPASRQKRTRR